MRDEGIIKFDCRWTDGRAPVGELVSELIEYRQRLFNLNLIGVYPDGIGFGNISARSPGANEFFISASQTGHISPASFEHFSIVTKYSIEQNWLECHGPLKASSESLTHAMIYQAFPDVNAVIHVHHDLNWQRLQNLVPTTAARVAYGTPAMAAEVERLAREAQLAEHRIMIMAGHEDGIISFGQNLSEALATLLKHLI